MKKDDDIGGRTINLLYQDNRMTCRICGNKNLEPILDLGEQPWCNDFRYPKDPIPQKYPLHLVYCPQCSLTQLDFTVKKETMFLDHTYVSGTTQTLKDHFFNLACENKIQFNLHKDDLIVDIGGNDGTQLLQYKRLGLLNVVNWESASNIAAMSLQSGVTIVNKFFNEDSVNEFLSNRESKAKLINASGVFFHLEELHSVCRGIQNLLDENGVFVVQFMYLKDMIESGAFDAIYHEHLCYYSLFSLNRLMGMYNMVLYDAAPHPVHGGSMIAKFVRKSSLLSHHTTHRAYQAFEDEGHSHQIGGYLDYDALRNFAVKAQHNRDKIREFLLQLKTSGAKIYGLGSPAKGTTMLNYCGIDNSILDKIYEVNELKFKRITPITGIPICPENDSDLPDYFFVLAWNFASEIVEKKTEWKKKGVKFILPLPTLTVV